MNVGAKVQFAGKNAVAASVAGKECDASSFQCTQYECVRRRAKRGLHGSFLNSGQPRHGVKSTASNDSDFSLRQHPLAWNGFR